MKYVVVFRLFTIFFQGFCERAAGKQYGDGLDCDSSGRFNYLFFSYKIKNRTSWAWMVKGIANQLDKSSLKGEARRFLKNPPGPIYRASSYSYWQF
jgi:hypothetical protein